MRVYLSVSFNRARRGQAWSRRAAAALLGCGVCLVAPWQPDLTVIAATDLAPPLIRNQPQLTPVPSSADPSVAPGPLTGLDFDDATPPAPGTGGGFPPGPGRSLPGPPPPPPPGPLIIIEQVMGQPMPRGAVVQTDVLTLPGVLCTVGYTPPSGGVFDEPGVGTARPAGLDPKRADRSGWARWLWTVDQRSPQGYAILTVWCEGNGESSIPIEIGDPKPPGIIW